MLRPITHAEYERQTAGIGYYQHAHRWHYFREALQFIREIQPVSSLEIGPYLCPVIVGGDTMDCWAGASPTYRHDARIIPWPMADKAYDVVIGLQVWEHLGDWQLLAFREAVRVARHAVLSFPLEWKDSDSIHDGITRETIAGWTDHRQPRETVVCGSGTRKRLVCWWDFSAGK